MRRGARLTLLTLVLAAATSPLVGQSVPKPLKTRFVLGDAEWRELPLRESLRANYAKCWQSAVNSILENKFDIAVMDKSSGYVRTTWNEGVIVLGGDWYYRVQVSLKFVFDDAAGSDLNSDPVASKLRVQVSGELVKQYKGTIKQYHRGYDRVILQDLLQDLQSKLGVV